MTWKVKRVRGETPSQSSHEAFPKDLVGNKFVDSECDPCPAIFSLLLSDALAQ